MLHPVRVDSDVFAKIKAVAEKEGCTLPEAVGKLLAAGSSAPAATLAPEGPAVSVVVSEKDAWWLRMEARRRQVTEAEQRGKSLHDGITRARALKKYVVTSKDDFKTGTRYVEDITVGMPEMQDKEEDDDF